MPHTLIVGQTNTGKTTLALDMCRRWKQAGFATLVLDPMLDTRWSGIVDLQTADKAEFLRAYFNSRNARVFIDESIEVASNSDKDIIYTATRGRHYGHANVYISQRANSVARNIRTMCFQVASFKQHADDAKILSREFGSDELMGVTKLQRGQFIWSNGFQNAKGKVF